MTGCQEKSAQQHVRQEQGQEPLAAVVGDGGECDPSPGLPARELVVLVFHPARYRGEGAG